MIPTTQEIIKDSCSHSHTPHKQSSKGSLKTHNMKKCMNCKSFDIKWNLFSWLFIYIYLKDRARENNGEKQRKSDSLHPLVLSPNASNTWTDPTRAVTPARSSSESDGSHHLLPPNIRTSRGQVWKQDAGIPNGRFTAVNTPAPTNPSTLRFNIYIIHLYLCKIKISVVVGNSGQPGQKRETNLHSSSQGKKQGTQISRGHCIPAAWQIQQRMKGLQGA